MPISAEDLIAALGRGASLAEVATVAGVPEREVRHLWDRIIRSKVPPPNDTLSGTVGATVDVLRDSYGVPHVFAENEPDLFYGLGFAMAQDRLWLMDYLRRKATGRLSEILGPRYVDQDYLYRILDFPAVCARNHALLGERWRRLLDGMAAGINRAIDQAGANLPIEFDLLGYRPEPWTPVDLLVGLRYQWWGLSGRLFQITAATILERELGDRLEEFQRPERGDLYIVADDRNAAPPGGAPAPVRDSLHPDAMPHGSNNWVIGGQRTRSGKPLLANDPHYSYGQAHGNFYPCHLSGAGHGEAGFVFLGTPGMMTGANDRIAWGFTNNGTSVRDLYAEELNPQNPTLYRKDRAWEPLAEREVEIRVKDAEPVRKTIRGTARGPIVNDVIPKIGPDDPPLALRWVGFEMIEDVPALIGMNTATNWAGFRQALGKWAVSVTNFIYGDVDNNIGYQMSARIPLRKQPARGIRPAGQPDHEWIGYIPFEGNPRIENPPDGIIATANNRPINPSYPWPLYGSYAGGTRQQRILQILTARTDFDRTDFRRMQYDSKSLIAAEVTPRIVSALRHSGDDTLRDIADTLATWDDTFRVDEIAPTIFSAFMDAWSPAYAAATLPEQATVRGAAGRAARRALVGEESLLSPEALDNLIATTMQGALQLLWDRFGTGQPDWLWGRAHTYSWPHPLGDIGHLGALLNGPRLPCSGGDNTINNVAPSHTQPFVAVSGPTYRLIADLSNTGLVLINSHCPTSAHPGSPHYADTIRDWAEANYQILHRERAIVEAEAEGITRISPA
jgi:penicillin amidase